MLSRVSQSLPPDSSQVIEEQNVVIGAFNFQQGRTRAAFSSTGLGSVDQENGILGACDQSSSSSCQPSTGIELSSDTPRRFFSFAVYASARLFRGNATAAAAVDSGGSPEEEDLTPYASTPVLLAQAEDSDGAPFTGTVRDKRNRVCGGVLVSCLSVCVSVCVCVSGQKHLRFNHNLLFCL